MRSNSREKAPPSDPELARRHEQSRRALLSRDDIERDYNLSRRWLELAALTSDGPPMLRISRRMVRHQRGTFEGWLASRTVASTSEPVETA